MAFALWILSNFVRWIRLKIYQYEVTFAIYMLTPAEKFIFSMCCPRRPGSYPARSADHLSLCQIPSSSPSSP